MRQLRSLAITAAAASLAVLVPAVSAHADGIVLESYTSARPDDANHFLSPVLDALASSGFIGGYDAIGRKYESEVSRPALSPEGLPSDFADRVERGHKAWIAGRFDEAVHILGPLVDAAHANTGAFAQNQPLRDKLLKALISLALSQARMGDPSSARSTFGEILRSFPDATLSRASYGPEAYTLFEQMRTEQAAAGHGRLMVKVGAESVVFINERFETVGTTTKPEVAPGEYRIYAQLGNKVSRNHRVVMRPGDDSSVTIDWGFDQVLHTSPLWTGMTFPTAADRERLEASYAATFANAVGAKAVAVVGIEQVRGHAAIVGALINLQTGREIRRASLAIDPDPPQERLRALAKFIAGDGPAAQGIDVMEPGAHVEVPAERTASEPSLTATGAAPTPTTDEPIDHATGSHRWGGWKYVAGGGAVAALGVGGVLVALDGHCATTATAGVACPNLYSTKVPGYIALGGGVALAALTVYLFVHHDQPEPTRSAYVVPTAGGMLAGFAATF